MASIRTESELKRVLEALSSLSERKLDSSSRVEAMELLTLSMPYFSALKRINRQIHTDVQSQKTRIGDERAKVDTARLALQNLKYEQAMLELEVKICQEFQSIFQDIQLHPLEEFQALHPDVEGDEHALMLSRLKFELQERRRLEAEKHELQIDRSGVVKENNDKKVKLEQAEKELKDLLAAAHAVRDKFESF